MTRRAMDEHVVLELVLLDQQGEPQLVLEATPPSASAGLGPPEAAGAPAHPPPGERT
jgi:hypothetical protein